MSTATRSLPRTIGAHAILLTYTAIALFPVILVIMNSFKSRAGIFGAPLTPPTPKTFDLIGYTTVIGQGDFIHYFQNSLVVTVASLFFVLLFGAMAAFALSEYRFRGNSLMGLYLALGIMIPIRLGTVAILQLMVASGLVNTLTALILVYTAQGLPLAVFILSEFMKQVSDDLKNAGRIDGLSEYTIFFRLVLPLVRPSMATVAVFTMIPIWNDLWFPLILAPSEETKTVTLGAQLFLGQFVTNWNAILAALSLAIMPVLILYVIFSRQLIRGITSGAVSEFAKALFASSSPGSAIWGRSHALAYHTNPGFEIAALVNRSDVPLPDGLSAYGIRRSFDDMRDEKPDVACVATYSDSHADYAVKALEAGCHVFVEKPLATTVADAKRVVAAAKANGKKLVIGYILRHHPSWIRLIAEARKLGGPYVFRMNLNQQSAGPTWETHKQLMQTTSPIVDCGVHYLDVMLQITDARPVEVRGMGVRLTQEVAPTMYNYGHLQVLFDDGSVGWYEAGWGPMISETAFFVKDVISPNGCVSIVMKEGVKSDDIDTHTKTSTIRLHSAATGPDGKFVKADEMLSMAGEPGHQDLCDLEQAFVLKAIREDMDLTRHMDDAVKSLAVCLAADERSGAAVKL